MKKNRPQAKDIGDVDILRVINELDTEWRVKIPGDSIANQFGGANTWDVEARFPAFPERVVRSKLTALVKRGLADGCPCGCRGDFYVTLKGRELLR